MKPKDPWKYVEPKDLTHPVAIDNKKWYFCTKCRCRATGKVGFYQLSHTDATHDPNWKPEGNLSPVQDPDPTPPLPLHPPQPPSSGLVDDDLVFTGIHCAPIVHALAPTSQREGQFAIREYQTENQSLVGPRHRLYNGVVHWVFTPNSGSSQTKTGSKIEPRFYCAPVQAVQPLADVEQRPNQKSPQWNSTMPVSNQREWRYLAPSLIGYVLTILCTILPMLVLPYHCCRYIIQWSTNLVLEIQSYLGMFIHSINVTSKQYFLLSTSMVWYLIYVGFMGSANNRTGCTTKISTGFPAKWLIFSAVMWSSEFLSGGQYLIISPIPHIFCTWCILRSLSIRQISNLKKMHVVVAVKL